MKNIKYLSFLSLVLPLCVGGCFSRKDDKIHIVCTIFPEYEFVSALTKDVENVDTRLLVNSKVDMHSFQPTVNDIVDVKNADLFVYVGGESDSWVNDVIKDNKNNTMSLIQTLGQHVKEEEAKEGMQEGEDEEEEEKEYDEHVWLSLHNASLVVSAIKERMVSIDPENAETYAKNATNYINSLNSLDNEYKEKLKNGTHNTLVFGDRFPFRYLLDDYGFDYYAAFKGCSAESEASFNTIIFLANKVDELNTNYILKTSTSDGAIASSIKNATVNKNQEIVSMKSLEIKEDSNDTYLSVMKENLDTLLKVTR